MTTRFWYLLSKKISGEAGLEELTELDELFRDNPEWAYSAGQLQKIWKTKTKETDTFSSEVAFDEHLARMKEKGVDLPGLEEPKAEPPENTTNRPAKKVVLQAATLVVVFIAVALVWKLAEPDHSGFPSPQAMSEVQTEPRSRIRVVLPDSSVVWLNGGSKMTYNEQFGIENRNVTLTGEGYFEVKKNHIPFIIHTNDIKIKVLGTVFNVCSYPDEKTETSLLHGSVEITLDKRPGEKYLLKPNEKLVVSNSKNKTPELGKTEPIVVLQHVVPTHDNTITETSWVEDKLVFENEPFADVAVKMERWFGVKIKIDDEKLAAERLRGSFTTESIQQAMEALQFSTRFHYEMKPDLITITK